MDAMHDIVGIAKQPNRKRVGRGAAAGGGSTAGRGNNGQKARTGGSIPAYFEGGQTPLIRRLTKRRGFRSHRRFNVIKLNLKDLDKYAVNGKIEIKQLVESGQILPDTSLKILGEGTVEKAYQVQANFISSGARAKIEAAGGTIEIVA